MSFQTTRFGPNAEIHCEGLSPADVGVISQRGTQQIQPLLPVSSAHPYPICSEGVLLHSFSFYLTIIHFSYTCVLEDMANMSSLTQVLFVAAFYVTSECSLEKGELWIFFSLFSVEEVVLFNIFVLL